MAFKDKNKEKEYKRKFYQENKEKIKEKSRAYEFNNKDRIKKRRAQYRLKNRDKIRESVKKYRLNHKDKILKYNKKWYLENRDVVKNKSHKWYIENKDRARKNNNFWVSKNKEKNNIYKRKYQLNKKYNITLDQFNEMLFKQENKCGICGNTFLRIPDIDHNHKTGKVRGLLCHNCNLIIGLAKDKLTTLNNAIKWIKERN
jgi:Recombination endonuclease VII